MLSTSFRRLVVFAIIIVLAAYFTIAFSLLAGCKSYKSSESYEWPPSGVVSESMEQAYWIRYVDVDGVYIVRLMGNMHREGDVFVYDECDAEIPVDELHVLKSKEGFTQYYDKYYGTDTDYDTVNPYDKIRMLEKGVKTIDGYNTVARMSNVYWAKIFDLARMIGVAP